MSIMALPMRRASLVVLVAGAYVAVFMMVLTRSPLLDFDWRVAMWRPSRQWPQLQGVLDVLVVAGQRGPTVAVALSWLGWRSWRGRDPRPLLVFLAALALLNMSVGAVKLGAGRLGPSYADTIGSAELFRGGDIFPSGHAANSVVIWGTLAHLAPRHRRAAGVLAALAALVVGLTTVYLGYHWFTDALGGWAAGALVLLALPSCERFAECVTVWGRGLCGHLRTGPAGGVPRRRRRHGRCGSTIAGLPSALGAVTSRSVLRASMSPQVNPVTTANGFHPRVWNERGPPRVPCLSQNAPFCSLRPEVME